MENSEHQPYIVAKTEKEFKRLTEAIKNLPDPVYQNIEKVSNGLVGIECYYKKVWNSETNILLPNNCQQITRFDDFIGCYCGDFFIKLPLPEKHYNYLFIELPKNNQQ